MASITIGPEPAQDPGVDEAIVLVRRDQLQAVRRSVLHAIPINALLGLASVAVAFHAGTGTAGLIWFSASLLINIGRAALCHAPCVAFAPMLPLETVSRSVDRHLRFACGLALLSGLVWAGLPALCGGYTTPQTLFYLTVTCGITAGAVTYGTAYARIPICFLTPPLLSVAACLFATGGFDRCCLGGTVLLYLLGLVRGTLQTEAVFCEASRSKNEARTAALSRERARAEAAALATEMERRATHDSLTGLLNRAGFAARVEAWLGQGPERPCLMLLDLDGFKSVNDVYGHEAGDRVLVQVAHRIRATLPPACLASRLGGDEFAVFFDAATEVDAPAVLAGRLVSAAAEPLEGFDVGRIGMSIGINDDGARDLTRMLSWADAALYAAKKAGRNHVHLFDDTLRQRLEMRRDAKRHLAEALAQDGAEVWLQPVFGQGGSALSGYEALVRWKHPIHGWIPPGDIVAVAGMKGLTETLFRFILERVCAAVGHLHALDRSDLHVALNVSPREMAQIPVESIVLEQLRARDLPTSMLEVEITEETAIETETVRDRLAALSRAGIRIALDDFGAGYASLGSLNQLRVQRVKIDRSLVDGVAADGGKRSLVEAVLGLGRSLGLEVVAEGIETQADLEALRGLGCVFMQGYLLGRPMPMQAALSLASPAHVRAA